MKIYSSSLDRALFLSILCCNIYIFQTHVQIIKHNIILLSILLALECLWFYYELAAWKGELIGLIRL